MTLEEIINKVSLNLNLPKEVVETAYMSFWDYIRESIQALPLKEDLTEEEFNELKCNFNIPSIGKLYVTYPRYRALKDRIKYFKAIQNDNNNKEN
jgi:hypothetical protein